MRCIKNVSLNLGKGTGLLVLPLTFIIFFDTIMRYLFSKPTIWGQELSTLIFGAYAVLGGAYALSMDKHVRMDLLYAKTKGIKRAILDICGYGFIGLFAIVLVWKGGVSAWQSVNMLERSGSVWNPPVYPFRCLIPMTGALILIDLVYRSIKKTTINVRK